MATTATFVLSATPASTPFITVYDPASLTTPLQARTSTGVRQVAATGVFVYSASFPDLAVYLGLFDDNATPRNYAPVTYEPPGAGGAGGGGTGPFTPIVVPSNAVTTGGGDFYIKRGDTREPIIFQATEIALDGTIVPVPLPTGTTVRFKMRVSPGQGVLLDAAADILDPVNGIMSYQWLPGDTATVGDYDAEYEATFPDGRKKTFPTTAVAATEYLHVHIIPDLD